MFDNADIIHRYTRAQALADGTLVDVTTTAQEAGIRYPTALTHTAWAQYVRVPWGTEGQDEAGRLWDIIYLLRQAIVRSPGQADTIHYWVHVRNDNTSPKRVLLKAVCGPDDDGSPCLTVMLPEED